jgi:hypothetical protein
VNADPTAGTGEPPAGASAGSATSSEEERARAAYEAELSRISSADMMLQATVSLLNIGARRLAPAEGGAGAASARPEGSEAEAGAGAAPAPAKRDLEQVRDAIDGVSALLGILERRIPETLGPLRDALAQLQLAYAREAKAAAANAEQAGQRPAEGGTDPRAGEPGDQKEPAAEGPLQGEDQQRGPGPAEASGRLWVPGR